MISITFYYLQTIRCTLVHDCAARLARFALARGTKITTLNRRKLLIYAVICVSPYYIPSLLRSHPAAFGLTMYFRQKASFLPKVYSK